MESIRCPWCGDPVRVDGDRWECGYCGDFGYISSLHASERAKLDRERNRSISFHFVFDASALEDDVPDDPEPEEEPRPVGPDDRAALEEAVRRATSSRMTTSSGTCSSPPSHRPPAGGRTGSCCLWTPVSS